MLLLLSFLFFLSSFFNDRLEQRDLGNYKAIFIKFSAFRGGRHVGIDIHSGIGFPIGQSTLHGNRF